MSDQPRPRVSRTRNIPRPNEYIKALGGECAAWALDEEKAPTCKGRWRAEIFSVSEDTPLDLEIGTGNGLHFEHRAVQNPQRCLVGIELKYKPLIQSVRRVVRAGAKNARGIRYNARLLSDLFAPGELNDVIVYFPDPYLKMRFRKRRLLTTEFFLELHRLQRPGSRLEFKTDSLEYFQWTCAQAQRSPYKLVTTTVDLHHSPWAEQNFMTAFEQIFLRQGLKINYAVWERG